MALLLVPLNDLEGNFCWL